MSSVDNRRPSDGAPIQDRRRKTDWVSYMATILSFVSWAVAFVVWAVLDMAAPDQESAFTRKFGVEVRQYWDDTLLPIAFWLLVAALCICVSAFIFNMLRKRRKTDKYKKSVIITGIGTIAGIILFISRFGDILFG